MHGYIITYRPSNSYNVYVHHIGNILYMVLLLLTWMMDGSPVSVCVKGENVWRESIWHIPIEVCVSSRSLRSYGLLTSEAIWHILSPFLLPLTHPSRNWSKVLCCVFTAFMTYDTIIIWYMRVKSYVLSEGCCDSNGDWIHCNNHRLGMSRQLPFMVVKDTAQEILLG